MIEHDGLWYLFITTSPSQPISVYTARTRPVRIAGWT